MAPPVKDSSNKALSTPSWVLGSLLLAFILGVFLFAPPSLPEFKQRILAFVCALLAGLFAFFMSGDIGLRVVSLNSKIGQITLKATGGLAVFVIVLWWWTSANSPVKVTKEEVKKVVEAATNKSTNEVKGAISESQQQIKAAVAEDGQKTRTVVQDAALSTLETMFPLAVRIPRDVDGTIIKIHGEPLTRVISYDKNMQPMVLHWGDEFHYFVFAEHSREVPTGTVYLQLGRGEDSLRLPLRLDADSENTLRIPGHSPRPMEAFIYNPSGVSEFSLKVTVYSSDRERGREEFRDALIKTPLGSYARQTYLSVSEDGVRLRSQPSNAESVVLRSMLKGTFVKVLETKDRWTHIRMPEGREGWIDSKYLEPIA